MLHVHLSRFCLASFFDLLRNWCVVKRHFFRCVLSGIICWLLLLLGTHRTHQSNLWRSWGIRGCLCVRWDQWCTSWGPPLLPKKNVLSYSRYCSSAWSLDKQTLSTAQQWCCHSRALEETHKYLSFLAIFSIVVSHHAMELGQLYLHHAFKMYSCLRCMECTVDTT